MKDHEHGIDYDDCDMIRQASDFSLALNMLSLAATVSRDQLAASTQSQLNGVVAMAQLARQCARGPGSGITLQEALDLAMQVAATVRES